MNSKHLKASLEERLTSLLPDQSEAALHDALAPCADVRESAMNKPPGAGKSIEQLDPTQEASLSRDSVIHPGQLYWPVTTSKLPVLPATVLNVSEVPLAAVIVRAPRW
jgi:hypothetical protein